MNSDPNSIDNNNTYLNSQIERTTANEEHVEFPVEVPSTFSTGPDLVLTDDQLRQAFYFRRVTHRIIDPSGKYWRVSGYLRAKDYHFLFELEEAVDGTLQYRHSIEALHANVGMKWEEIGRSFHDRNGHYHVPQRGGNERDLRTESTFQPEPRAELEGQTLEEYNAGSLQLNENYLLNYGEISPLWSSNLPPSEFSPEKAVCL
ncbi:hypothetical protein N7456_011258 [Penicillium angulare]|uniref:Uncharacterized protein n=1 Tax=Penicillium angulare TaxID=116970 RepID=A0A9W9ETC0_9EURO|nr:hypothetical protein N7456_011258 [Penicillium angulare]